MPLLLHLKSLLALAVIATASLGLGALAARALRWRLGDRRLALVGETTLGLVVAGAAIMLLAIAECLYRPAILGFTFAGALAGMLRLRRVPEVEAGAEPESRTT